MSETTPESSPRASKASIRNLLCRTIRLYRKEGRHPGPWEDCDRIARAACSDPEAYRDLYPDLVDGWGDVIAGTCSFGKSIFGQPTEWLMERKQWLSKPFFDYCPEYQPLRPFVTEAATPELHRELQTYEALRVQLLEVIDWVLAERSDWR